MCHILLKKLVVIKIGLSIKEKKKAVQRGLGIPDDGIDGPQTWDMLYRQFADKISYPYAEKFWGGYIIFGRELNIHNSKNKKDTGDIPFSISGTFQWRNNAVSILIKDGQVINRTSSHKYTLDLPESYIAKLHSGEIVYRSDDYIDENELRYIDWAVSGLGLVDYKPSKEGFFGRFADVLRNTAHTGLGVTQTGEIVLLYKKCTGWYFRDWAINKLRLKYAIMLDGGHIASINAGKYKKNINQVQNNILSVR